MLYKKENIHGGDVNDPQIIYDFSVSLNPLGPPESVIRAIQDAAFMVDRYPDPYCRELLRGISGSENMPEDFILCGNGAMELINAYADALKPEKAVVTAPSFSEYEASLKRNGCSISRYQLREENDFKLDEGFIRRLKEIKPDAVFLCSPNNPDGGLIPDGLFKEILGLCEEQGCSLFLDECFTDLSDGDSKTECAKDHENLFVLKAFTKSFAIAGLRLGYCVSGNTDLLSEMAERLQPWNVSVPAQMAGVQALKEKEYIKRSKELIKTERDWLFSEFSASGLKVIPSGANYLLSRIPKETSSEKFYAKLKDCGIMVRRCSSFAGLSDRWFRAGIKKRSENEILVKAVREAVWQKA